MTAHLQSLLERVEKAKGPDRELDAEIGVLIRYHTAGPSHWLNGDDVTFFKGDEFEGAIGATCNEHDCGRWKAPCYTASLDAVVALVERMLPGWKRGSGVDADGPFAWVRKKDKPIFARSATEALSYLAALLKALIEQDSNAT